MTSLTVLARTPDATAIVVTGAIAVLLLAGAAVHVLHRTGSAPGSAPASVSGCARRSPTRSGR